MKTKFVIIGIVLVVGVITIILISNYISILEFEAHNTSEQLQGVFDSCLCQERIKVNPDMIERCTDHFVDWENATHYIDNNICEWKEK